MRTLSRFAGVALGAGVSGALAQVSYFDVAEQSSSGNDRVLQHMQAGVAAFEANDLASAKRSFLVAYESIETIYADNEAARRARSSWYPEATKDFRGEPYERAAVGYYLGLVDMAGGDYDNARASFRWGMFQDTMSSSETYQADMASLAYLRGWASACGNASGAGAEDFAEFARLKPGIPVPTPQHTLLVIAETGAAPQKFGTGQYSEALQYQRGPASPVARIQARVGATSGDLYELEDLFWQASTLGGRHVDKILAGKASFKADLQATGEALGTVANVSAQMAQVSALAGNLDQFKAFAGLGGLAAIGSLVSSAASSNVQPAADTRAWNNLPERISMGAFTVKAPKNVSVRFQTGDGAVISDRPARVYGAGRCSFAWSREHSAVAVVEAKIQQIEQNRVYAEQQRQAAAIAAEQQREADAAARIQEQQERGVADVPTF